MPQSSMKNAELGVGKPLHSLALGGVVVDHTVGAEKLKATEQAAATVQNSPLKFMSWYG